MTDVKKSIVWAFVVFMAAATLSSCGSQLPIATTFPSSTQRKMQAAQHWDVLASEVADRVEVAFVDRPDLAGRPIFVPQKGASPFAAAFHELLISQLVFRGMQVSVAQEDSLVLDYSVLGVKHNWRFQRPKPGLLTALPGGAWAVYELSKLGYGASLYFAAATVAGALLDYGIGHWATESDNEVIITASLSYNNRYVLHMSNIYYINDPDKWHYAGGPSGGRTLRVVNE